MLRRVLYSTVLVAIFQVYKLEGKPYLERQEYSDVSYFNCTGKKSGGRYSHPTDCTRYIQCKMGQSLDRPCAPCILEESTCPEGFLYFDSNYDVCNWPKDVNCTTAEDSDSFVATARRRREPDANESLLDSAPEARAPKEKSKDAQKFNAQPIKPAPPAPPSLPLKFPEALPVLPPALMVPTAVDPVRIPTSARPSRHPSAVEGAACDPYNCTIQGYCLNFTSCKRISSDYGPLNDGGVIVNDECGKDHEGIQLYFNPEKSQHGGVCGYWSELTANLQATYKNDLNCVPKLCEYSTTEPCTANYFYYDGKKDSKPIPQNCSKNLVWDATRRTCHDPCFAMYLDAGNVAQPCKKLLRLTCT